MKILKSYVLFIFIFMILTPHSTLYSQNSRFMAVSIATNMAEYTWNCWYFSTTVFSNYFTYGNDTYYECDYEQGSWDNIGMPYAFGQKESLNDFSENVNSWNLGPGNHQCHYVNWNEDVHGTNTNNWTPCDWTTGTDCSGLVCTALGISQKGTNSLLNMKKNIRAFFL